VNRRSRNSAPAQPARKRTGRVSPQALAELATRAYGNAVCIVAGMDDNVARARALGEFEAVAGKDRADKLRRDVWALMQGVRGPG
jgi:hypothetical protein